jgi:hypothetical protein
LEPAAADAHGDRHHSLVDILEPTVKMLDQKDIQFVKQSKDDNKLFIWEDELFRLISSEGNTSDRWARLNKFVTSPQFSNLVENRYVPRFTPTEIKIKGWPGYIYRVESIDFTTQSIEWTLLQKVDALNLICNINTKLIQSGSDFIANDCNLAQVTFHNSNPIFLDIGSFSDTMSQLAKSKFCNDFSAVMRQLKLPSRPVVESFNERDASSWERAKTALDALSADYITDQEPRSVWDNYGKHVTPEFTAIYNPRGKEERYLLSRIGGLPDLNSVFDAGASNGRLSLLFAAHGKQVLSADYAKRALSNTYLSSKKLKLPITVAYIDLVNPIQPHDPPLNNEFDDWNRRLRADAVVASSITHHLYRAGMSFDDQAERLGSIASKYMLIEYIDPSDKHVKKWGVGEDYTRGQFLKSFSRDWDILEEGNPVQPERTWFVMKKRNPCPSGRAWYDIADPNRAHP